MDKIYESYDNEHVRKVFLYAKANDAYAYADSAKTVKVAATDLQDLYRQGLIIVDGGVEYHATSFKLDTGVGTVTYAKADGTTPTTAVLATLVSKEYTAG